MVTAKFHAIGDSSAWIRTRIQEEVHHLGLEGTVLAAGENTIAIIVEGSIPKIDEFYKNLVEWAPENVQYTSLEFTERSEKSIESSEEISKSLQTMIELLKEIERHTRRMNQKLDQALTSGVKRETDTQDVWEEDETSSWGEQEVDDSEDDGAGGFASMFGD